jgi:beta-galactosidase
MKKQIVTLGLTTLLLACLNTLSAEEPSYIWMEGEAPARENHETHKGGWGKTHLLSEGSWLHFSLKPKEMPEAIRKDGVIMEYDFEVAESGSYDLWHRVGYEYVRSPYEWRLNDGPWTLVKPRENLTVDLMAIAEWTDMGWMELGEADLPEGEHTLTLRVRPELDESGKPSDRLLFATDAILLTQEAFMPNGPHKPDANWQSERDRAAAEHVFDMAEAEQQGARRILNLAGDWQYARWGERFLEDRTGPIPAPPAPERLHWSAIEVPADRNEVKPDESFAHRFFYRARVNVPASMEGQSFFFTCEEASMLTTVFVNGQRAGFSDAALAPFRFDITDAIRPGQVNEIWVGIKDVYYAPGGEDEESGLSRARSQFNVPLSRTRGQGFTLYFDYPVARYMRCGMMDAVRLEAAGPAYADDVYVIPSVSEDTLTVETTLKNPTGQEREAEVRTHIVHAGTDDVVKTLSRATATVPAGGTQLAKTTDAWKNPRLWWPDDPHLYEAVTGVYLDGKLVDTARTRFGFREWSIEGTRFALNGIPWQFRANLAYYGAADGKEHEAVAFWKQSGQNMFRLRFQFPWAGMTQNEALDFFDEQGIPVRKTVSNFDGQMASYWTVKDVMREGEKVRVAREFLYDNWRKQVAARVKHQRNHPCIFVWELDNEIIYINERNRGWLDYSEPEFKKAAQMVAELDRQGRGQMVAGGRALRDKSLPINGTHYEATANREYPDAAYGLEEWAGTGPKKPWPMALDKPIFLGEEFFAHGPAPEDFAGVGGEIAFTGAAGARTGIGRLARMYSEGYRWQELAAFHYWFRNLTSAHHPVWQPVLALCREWNWTFASGERVERTIMVRNDTRYDSPITFEWAFQSEGQVFAQGSRELKIEPGHGETLTIATDLPTAQERLEGELRLVCRRDGEIVWQEAKPFSVIYPDAAPVPEVEPGEILVWDDSGKVGDRLRERGIPFQELDVPEDITEEYRLLIIGPDTVPASLATDPIFYSESLEGRRVLVLDQESPLHFKATPSDVKRAGYTGTMAFSQDLRHPIFAGLAQEDLHFWSGDHVVYRNVYEKPSTGGRSLIHCDHELQYTALVESNPAEGLMLLCQAAVGTRLDSEPVAQRLFDNLVNYALDYERVARIAEITLPEDDPRVQVIEDTGATVETGLDLARALEIEASSVVIAEASPRTLDHLLDNRGKLERFFARGSDLMLWNLGPEGLDRFNELVGQEHLIRPFTREKIMLNLPRHSLTTGLSQRNLRMTAGSLARHKRREWVSDDAFTHVLSLDSLVPFLKGPGIEPDHNGGSIANGFTDKEFWRYVHYIGFDPERGPPTYSYELPRPETLTSLSITPNSHYHRVTKLRLTFQQTQGRETVRELELAPYERGNNPRQDFDLEVEDVVSFDLDFLEWIEGSKSIVGIDNLWINVKRPPAFYEQVQSLTNVGVLVYYPMGEGGILLNQVNVEPNEARPEHARKKQAIVSALLRNLKVEFPGKRVILPGEGLQYKPVSLEGKANVYLTKEQGWPAAFQRMAGGHDLARLPIGRQTFDGVQYEIRDFLTSPLENGIGLGERAGLPDEVTGIQVNQKADAFFFLHTMLGRHVKRWLDNPGWQEKEPNPALFHYRIHYADGKTTDVAVNIGLDIHVLDRLGTALDMKNASVVWSAPFVEGEKARATLYSMQWNNPRPDVAIESIDIIINDNKQDWWGNPLVLGITAADVIE